ncbi:hypothetical protein Ancab_012042 [Ancistrocladus abbreviatus]
MKGEVAVENGFAKDDKDIHLTVCKTSHFFAGDGFTVYDCHGQLVYRVDSYGGPDTRDKDEMVLMDAVGHCLFTVRRKVIRGLILFRASRLLLRGQLTEL